MDTIVSASILSADLCRLGSDIDRAREGGADHIHFDVMDGVFVNNISYGIPVLKSVRKYTDMFIDAHLMITDPSRYIKAFADGGADNITFHLEAAPDPLDTISRIRAEGIKAGMLRPVTLWPFPEQAYKDTLSTAKVYLDVEMSMGQMVNDVKLAIECTRPVHFFGHTGGIIPTPAEVLAQIKALDEKIRKGDI